MKSDKLRPGDEAVTTSDGPNMIRVGSRVTILARRDGSTRSGVEFQVSPPMRLTDPDAWYDSGWFASAVDDVAASQG